MVVFFKKTHLIFRCMGYLWDVSPSPFDVLKSHFVFCSETKNWFLFKPDVIALVCQDGASARRFRPSSSTRESLAMAVAERKAAMAKHKDSQAVCQFSKAYMTSFISFFGDHFPSLGNI